MIQQKYQWSDYTMRSVNRNAHGTSLRRNIKKRTYFIELVHGILPTNSVINRKGPVRCLFPSCRIGRTGPMSCNASIINAPCGKAHWYRIYMLSVSVNRHVHSSRNYCLTQSELDLAIPMIRRVSGLTPISITVICIVWLNNRCR